MRNFLTDSRRRLRRRAAPSAVRPRVLAPLRAAVLRRRAAAHEEPAPPIGRDRPTLDRSYAKSATACTSTDSPYSLSTMVLKNQAVSTSTPRVCTRKLMN